MAQLSRKQQIAAAPKYGLYIEGAGWLANKQQLSGIVFTQDKELAQQFAEGFDNPSDKLAIWNAEAKRMFNNAVIKFEAVAL